MSSTTKYLLRNVFFKSYSLKHHEHKPETISFNLKVTNCFCMLRLLSTLTITRYYSIDMTYVNISSS
jgi:hypothetical protein